MYKYGSQLARKTLRNYYGHGGLDVRAGQVQFLARAVSTALWPWPH